MNFSFLQTRLFWKIFILFWISLLGIVTAVILILFLTFDAADWLPEKDQILKELEVNGIHIQSNPRPAIRLVGRLGKFRDRMRRNRQLPLDLGRGDHLSPAPPPAFFPSFLYIVSTQGEVFTKGKDHEAVKLYSSQTKELEQPRVLLQGEKVIAGPYRLRLDEETFYLYLAKKIPSSNMFELIVSYLKSKWIVYLVILLMAGAFFTAVTTALVIPVQQMRRTVRMIANGKFEVLIDKKIIERKDELGYLAKDVNQMSVQLEGLIGAQEELLREVSHELRAPLTRLQLALTLARKKTENQAVKEHGRIETEIGRLNELISQIIYWSKLKNLMHGQHFTEFNLSELVKDIVMDVNFEAQAQNREVRLVGEDLSILMKGLTEEMGSAIENIVRNAVRYTPEEGTVDVAIALSDSSDKTENKVIVTIQDQGPGVPEDSLSLLFDPFYQVNDQNPQKKLGSGLGMAISRRVMDIHQGSIRAENMNPGLKVSMSIPLRS